MVHLSSPAQHDRSTHSLEHLSYQVKDLVHLRLANIREIDALAIQGHDIVSVKHTIDNWFLICMTDKETHRPSVFLVGNGSHTGRPMVTSELEAIDFERGVVTTRNKSNYGLGMRGYGDLSREQLLCLEAAMYTWNLRHEA